MKLHIIIDKEINCCKECPFHYQLPEDVSHSCCTQKGERYSAFLGDITYKNNHEKISDFCPFLEGEN